MKSKHMNLKMLQILKNTNVIHIEHYDNSPQWYKRKQEDY